MEKLEAQAAKRQAIRDPSDLSVEDSEAAGPEPHEDHDGSER
jgi:hypothetical protein